MAVQARGVDFILVSVSDMERSRKFYGETLGLKAAAEWPPSWYEFEAGETTVALGTPPENAPQPPFTQSGVSFALAVADAKAALDELQQKGVKVVMPADETSVCHMGMIVDPDGNQIWIHQRKDGTAG
jgi:predicted enzyme related to lactoylglutathione lyase